MFCVFLDVGFVVVFVFWVGGLLCLGFFHAILFVCLFVCVRLAVTLGSQEQERY